MPFTRQNRLRCIGPGRSRCRFLDAQLRREKRMSSSTTVAAHALHNCLRGCRANLIRELVHGGQRRDRGIAIVKIVVAYKRDIFRTTQSSFTQSSKHTESDKVVGSEDGGGSIFDPK